MKKVLITGSTGFVGSRLCREMLEHGYTVNALHRKSSDLSSLKDLDVRLIEGDINDLESLRRAMTDVTYVFHIAALFRQAKFTDEVYRKVNLEGTENVLRVARERGVNRVIHCSTVGVHSHIPKPPANESEPYRPGDIYQETKAEGEKIAQEWFRSGKLNGVVIRPAMIWGPGDKRTLKLYKGIAKRRFVLIGTGETLVHWVMVDDLVKGFRLAAEKPQAAGQTYIFAGERPVTLKYLISTIANAIGVKPLPFRIPAAPVQILGDIVEAICIPLKIEPPIYRRRVDFFTKTRAFDCTKARAELGYRPKWKFEDEVKVIVNWYIDKGWI